MPFPDHCIPVKGFFPESAKGIEDSFVLVSLDADLYDPIYAGLHFFFGILPGKDTPACHYRNGSIRSLRNIFYYFSASVF